MSSARQILRRRGTTLEHQNFAGAEGEITIDVTKKTVVVHDGQTAGGFPLARFDQHYTKDEIDAIVTGGLDVNLDGYYTSEEVDAHLEAMKAALLASEELLKASDFEGLFDAKMATVSIPSKSSDLELDNVMTDQEVTDLVKDFVKTSVMNSALGNYYTKEQIDTMIAEGSGIDGLEVVNGTLYFGNNRVMTLDFFASQLNDKLSSYVTNAALTTALGTKANVTHGHDIGNITGLGSKLQAIENELDSKMNTADLTSFYSKLEVDNLLSAKSASDHKHSFNDLLDKPAIPDVSDYYTKGEVDTKIAGVSSGGSVDLSNYYDKSEVDDRIAEEIALVPSADLTNYYDKTEVDTRLEGKSDDGHQHDYNDLLNKPAIPNVSDYYSKTEVDTKLEGKSDVGHKHDYNDLLNKPAIPDVDNYYSKAETEQKISEAVEAVEVPEVDLTDYYNKAEVDQKIAAIPTGGGEVDLTDYYNKTAVDQALAGKADADHQHSYNDLADKPAIPDVSDYYTKEEVDSELSAKSDLDHNHDFNDLLNKPNMSSYQTKADSDSFKTQIGNRVTGVEGEVDSVSTALQQTDTKVSNLETELATANSTIEELNTQLTAEKGKVAQLNTDLDKANSDLDTERKRIDNLILRIQAIEEAGGITPPEPEVPAGNDYNNPGGIQPGHIIDGREVEYVYPFTITGGRGSYTFPASTSPMPTLEEFYGVNFDGTGTSAEVRFIGLTNLMNSKEDKSEFYPGQVVPLTGIQDDVPSPSRLGSVSWDPEPKIMLFTSVDTTDTNWAFIKYKD
jgi:uncharacterized coiled-coil protein SlyX